jgi:methylglyoxal synthase
MFPACRVKAARSLPKTAIGGHSGKMATLALIAHDGKKDEMVSFAQTHRERLSSYELIATGSTGRLIAEATGLPVKAYRHGPAGGDVQIAGEVLQGNVAAVFFFVEPMDVHPHDPDIQTLLRTCNIENVPLASNPATADLVIKGLSSPG